MESTPCGGDSAYGGMQRKVGETQPCYDYPINGAVLAAYLDTRAVL